MQLLYAAGVSFHSDSAATEIQLLKLCATSVHIMCPCEICLTAMGLNVVWTLSCTSISQFLARQGVLILIVVAWGCCKVSMGVVNWKLVLRLLKNSIMHVCARGYITHVSTSDSDPTDPCALRNAVRIALAWHVAAFCILSWFLAYDVRPDWILILLSHMSVTDIIDAIKLRWISWNVTMSVSHCTLYTLPNT